jgi:hypothetical protein
MAVFSPDRTGHEALKKNNATMAISRRAMLSQPFESGQNTLSQVSAKNSHAAREGC